MKQLVSSSIGKWLEPTEAYPEFTVILARKDKTDDELLLTAVHELQHVADFMNSAKITEAVIPIPDPPNIGFVGRSEFKAVYAATTLELRMRQAEDGRDMFRTAAGILGYKTADAMEGILRARESEDGGRSIITSPGIWERNAL